MKKFIIFALLTAIFQVPASALGTKDTMNKIMESWVGEPINTVISLWGYPAAEKTIAGRKLYTWYDEETYKLEYSVYIGNCIRIFEVNEQDDVIKWEWKGSNCPATKYTSKKWANPNNDPWRRNTI